MNGSVNRIHLEEARNAVLVSQVTAVLGAGRKVRWQKCPPSCCCFSDNCQPYALPHWLPQVNRALALLVWRKLMEEIAESFASCLSKQTGTGGVHPGLGANVSYEDLSEINPSMEPESIFFTPLYALILTDLLKKYEYTKIVHKSVGQSYSSLRGLHLRVMY